MREIRKQLSTDITEIEEILKSCSAGLAIHAEYACHRSVMKTYLRYLKAKNLEHKEAEAAFQKATNAMIEQFNLGKTKFIEDCQRVFADMFVMRPNYRAELVKDIVSEMAGVDDRHTCHKYRVAVEGLETIEPDTTAMDIGEYFFQKNENKILRCFPEDFSDLF